MCPQKVICLQWMLMVLEKHLYKPLEYLKVGRLKGPEAFDIFSLSMKLVISVYEHGVRVMQYLLGSPMYCNGGFDPWGIFPSTELPILT